MDFYEEDFEEYVTPADTEFGYYSDWLWNDNDSDSETESHGKALDIQD